MAIFTPGLSALERDIANATDYKTYREASLAHDALSGADEWKHEDASKDYDYRLIRKRVERMQAARKLQDVYGLMSIIHEGLHGNLGNIANPTLLGHCRIGTKNLIQNFIDEVVIALTTIYDADESLVDFYEKKLFFEETAYAFGQSCLMLSGGAGLGFFHAGVVKSLNQQNLLPGVISGASAGAIIAALIGTRQPEELETCLSPEFILEKFRYWRHWSGFGKKSLFDSRALENTLIELFDIMTFEEAYALTGKYINISVSPADLHQQSRVLNAKTAPRAVITQAIRASTAVPVFFSPVQLKAKNLSGDIVPYIPNRRFVDGSMMADLPYKQLSRLYGVNHSIVSQTNPLAIPFIQGNRSEATSITGMTFRHLRQLAKTNSVFAFDVLEKCTGHRGTKLAIHKVRSIIDQQYIGNINILPHRQLRSLTQIMANPTLESVTQLVTSGERATWEHIDIIKRNTQISETLRCFLAKLKNREARVSGHATSSTGMESVSM